MKNILILFSLLACFLTGFGQQIKSGEYGSLRLAYDPTSKKITGYFEDYTGWDETSQSPRFSCVFYLAGTATSKKVKIKTYHPEDQAEGLVEGTLEIINDKTVKIKLDEEQGGCWNVQHFADEPAEFELEKEANWSKIGYITATKTYFYSEKSADKKMKAYLIKSNFICIEKKEGDWTYCAYYGKKVTKGWMKVSDIFGF